MFNLCSNAEADIQKRLTLVSIVDANSYAYKVDAVHGKTDARTDLVDADANSTLVESD